MQESFVLLQFLLVACLHLYSGELIPPLKLIQTMPVPQVTCENPDLH